MKPNDLPDFIASPRPMDDPVGPGAAVAIGGMLVVGELLAVSSCGDVPLVVYPGQPVERAIAARSIVDLHGAHVGRPVALMFERGDPLRPVVMGVVRGATGWPAAMRPDAVQVDVDGDRLIIDAREQLVLRCGDASITLKSDGTVRIQGESVTTHASGVNRVKGGSVQLN